MRVFDPVSFGPNAPDTPATSVCWSVRSNEDARRGTKTKSSSPRIVRLFSQPVELPISGTLLLLNNADKPGIVDHLGTLLGKHKVNIASMSLGRDTAGGRALTVLSLDSVPPQAMLDELQKDADISIVKVVKL